MDKYEIHRLRHWEITPEDGEDDNEMMKFIIF